MRGDASAALGAVVITLFWGVWLAWSMRRDARRLRNGFLLVALIYSAVALLGRIFTLIPHGRDVFDVVGLVVTGALGLALLSLPVFLIVNGLTMIRRERRSLGNLLSLLAGLAMLIAPVTAILLAIENEPWTWALAAAVTLTAMWFSYTFLGFAAQTLLYRRFAERVPANGVIVLGSRVVSGRVPPLLAGRLRAAMAAAERLGRGSPVPIVPSGGQGSDEERPEGVAMAEWLTEQGVPESQILVEDQARTTRENLTYSVTLLRDHGVDAPYLMATNNYHAPRAALEAMDLGLGVHAIGAPTAGYFFPSAYLREFIAVLRRRPAVHALAAAFVLAMSALVYLVALRM